MSKETVDVQDYLDDMADGFVGDEATNEEFEKVQTLISQAFCFGIERKQQEIESLKAQLEEVKQFNIDIQRSKHHLNVALSDNDAYHRLTEKELTETKAKLAQYQRDDCVLMPKMPGLHVFERGFTVFMDRDENCNLEVEDLISAWLEMFEAQKNILKIRERFRTIKGRTSS